MSSCYCDYDAPEFYIKDTRKARKQHRCDECGCHIPPGETYENVTAKWDGEVSSMKTCSHCLELRDWVVGNVPCACWLHGNMMEGLSEAIEDAVYRAPDETHGLTFGFWRRRYNWRKSIQLRLKEAA